MEVHMIDANDGTLLTKLQEYTHFGNNIKIFIKLCNTIKTTLIKYVDIFPVFGVRQC